MVNFVAFSQPSKNGHGIFHSWLADFHRLKTSLQGRVFLDVFAILIQRRRSDRAEFSASQLRLKKVRGIHRSFTRPGTHNGVKLVDEENDLTIQISHLFKKSFETILKLSPILGARDHPAQVERDKAFIFHRIGNIPADDASGQALNNSSLAYSGFPNENWIVLGPTRKHLEDTANFLVPANHRINLSFPSAGREVLSVFFQSLVFSFGILVGDLLASSNFLESRLHLPSC